MKIGFGRLLLWMSLMSAGCVAEGEKAAVDDESLVAADPNLVQCNVTKPIPANELVITNLGVVEDSVRTNWSGSLAKSADGAWHFGRLMTAMAGKNDPSTFVKTWLSTWMNDQRVNSSLIVARPLINDVLIKSWPTVGGKLNLAKAPMRLLAIVNRMDLRQLSQGNAGEGRFVFGVLINSSKGGAPQTRAAQFTVILEYKLPAKTRSDVLRWANDWHALSKLKPGTPAFNTFLQLITDRFTAPNATPNRPNGSAISQVRTNEIELSRPWELREFQLNGKGMLAPATVALTPDARLNNTKIVGDFINKNEAAILSERFTVPPTFGGIPFLGAASPNEPSFWSAPNVRINGVRHKFSLNTCAGCHGVETATGFLHISPREKNAEAVLSGFMTGEDGIPDPVVPVVTRSFNDLERRAVDLKKLLCGTTVVSLDAASARVH